MLSVRARTRLSFDFSQGVQMFARVVFSLILTVTLALQLNADSQSTAIVLCYHVVESPQDTIFTISRETFRQQMRYLTTTGYKIIPLADLHAFVAGKKKSIPKNAVVVTVDDGWKCTYSEIYPEMKRLRLPFTAFLYPKFVGQSAYALNWKQIKEMADNGVDIQSHTFSHAFLTKRRHSSLGSDNYANWLHDELTRSKKRIEEETGKKVRYLAYPYGDYDSKVAEGAERAGYDAALTCDYGPVRQGSDPFRMKRVIVHKNTSFEMFRAMMGADSLRLTEEAPSRGQTFDPANPVISARIANYSSLDPSSVGMALLSVGSTPYSYDPANGSISLVVRDSLKGRKQQAVVWGNDRKSGRRVEAIWTFNVGEEESEEPLITAAKINTRKRTATVSATTTVQTPNQPAAIKPAVSLENKRR